MGYCWGPVLAWYVVNDLAFSIHGAQHSMPGMTDASIGAVL